MKLLKFLSFVAAITYQAKALPDTNIQIQHYDGPVYLSTTPDCCPFCNSILKPATDIGCETPCGPPQIIYPQTIVKNTCDDEPTTPCEITITLDTNEHTVTCDNSKTNTGTNSGKSTRENKCEYPVNYGSMLHTDPLKMRSVHNIPVTSNNLGPYGNTYPGTEIGHTRTLNHDYCTHTPTGTEYASTNQPLSSYLPINTASQNTCYQVPIHTYGANSDGPVLVPQKFIYSFILDGDAGSNQNEYDAKCYYY